MAAETQYTANTGMVTLTAANTSLSGGTLGTDLFSVITGASNGTLIKTLTIKCQGVTTEGMVRLWIYDGSTKLVISEIPIPAVTPSAQTPAFVATVPLDYVLKSGWQLLASTQNYTGTAGKDKFNVIAEGQDWVYSSPVRAETTKYAAYNGATQISTANSSLDGTGASGSALVSSGCNIWSVTIKAQQSTTAGMVRLFLYDGTNTKLLAEVPVTAITRSATVETFYHKIKFDNGFALKSGWQLKASTEKGEAFSVIAESVDWSYPTITCIDAENSDRLQTENGYYFIT